MGLIKKTEHAGRYKDLAKLLIKYGRSDIVKQAGLYETDLDAGAFDGMESKAESLPDDLEQLGPTYIKLGQFLSTRPDFLPAPYLDALSRLQDKVAPFSFEEVEEVVTHDLGIRLSKAFESFEHEPVASASLGQVHMARLRDGRPVAVKVQRPDIRKQVFKDLDAFDDLSEFLEKHTTTGQQLMLTSTLHEFRKSMLRELDYREEALNLKTIRKNLEKFPDIVIPDVIDDYSSSRVLTMDYIRGKNITKLSPLVQLEFDGNALAEELFKAYMQQILIDGFYHADPHPGNIFITEDKKLALLDMGMVAHVSGQLQLKLVRLLIAISEGNGEQAAEYALQISSQKARADVDGFRRQVSEYLARNQEQKLGQLEIGRLVLELTKISAGNGIRLPDQVIMLGKTLLNLDKVGRTLDPQFDPNASLRRNTSAILQKYMIKNTSPGSFYDYLLDMKEFFEYLPARVNKIMDTLAENRFTLNTKVIDEKYFMDELKEAANRLTLGMILASLIIGAALLMRIETSFTILGYPGIAILFFLVAGIGGIIIALRIVFDQRNKED